MQDKMMMGTGTGSSNGSNLFRTAQWEELEQQALFYKYMVSGVPVPTDLILSVRRSLYHSSFSSSSSLFSSSTNKPTLGVWEGSSQYNQLYQMRGGGGYGRKIDLEPGRCRRTDGKKWRCSKEAYPDSKYCERHMHRGRNRSRKPVEFSFSSSSSSTNTTVNVSSPSSTTTLTSKSISPCDSYPLLSSYNNQNTLLYPHYSSSRPPALSPANTTIQSNFMDSSSYSHQILKDYRYLQGMKDLGEDERSAYFQLHDPYTTQKMAAASSSDHHKYSGFNFQNLNNQFKEQQEKEEEAEGQHCFVRGTDFTRSSEEASKCIQIDTKAEETTHNHTHMTSKQSFHHFFSPPKTTSNHDPTWVEVDQHHHFINPPKSPLSTQDLFQSKPGPHR